MKKKGLIAIGVVLCLLLGGLFGSVIANEREERFSLVGGYLSELNIASALVSLTIHVVDKNLNKSIPGASIIGKRFGDINYNGTVENETWYFYGETDENGMFTVDVVPDAYYIYVYAEAYIPKSISLSIEDTNGSFYVEIALNPLPEPDSMLKGRVLNYTDGSPIPNATVCVWSEIGEYREGYWPSECIALTDENGSYVLNVRSGVLVLYAYAEGYHEYTTSVNVPPNTTMHLDIGLVPFKEPETVSQVRGKVISSEGAVEGAYVEFMYYADWYSAKLIDEAGVVWLEKPLMPSGNWTEPFYPGAWTYSTITDANGSYTVDVPAGWLSLTVFADGFYPHYDWIFVEANTVLWLNISLEKLPEPDAWIVGTVYNEQGQRVKGAYVSAYALQESVGIMPVNGTTTTNNTYGYYAASTETDENGKFTLGVPGGQYMLSAFHQEFGGYYAVIEVERNTTLCVELTLSPITNGTGLPDNGTGGNYVVSPPKDIGFAPKFIGSQEITLSPGTEYRLNFSALFKIPQGKRYVFGVRETNYISAVYNSATGELLLRAPENWHGEEAITVEATDGITTVIGTILVKILGSSPVPIALWFGFGVIVAIAVITVVWYRQRINKQRK